VTSAAIYKRIGVVKPSKTMIEKPRPAENYSETALEVKKSVSYDF
jgi:hypothetical protein